MVKLLKEIIYDARFIRDHELQPAWYKILKVFLVLGLLGLYNWIAGGLKTAVFCGIFFGLSLVLHLIYRIKTKRYTRSWLDFKVVEKDGEYHYDRIGHFYYIAVASNALIALLISQLAFS